MVTFSCDNCNDTVKKPKANQHAQRCRGSLTCIDCSKTFWSGEWNAHNSCISEAEAYQGALYKPTKKELKRKAAEAAAMTAQSAKTVPAAPDAAFAVTSAPEQAFETKHLLENEEVTAPQKKRSKHAASQESMPRKNITLLDSVVPKDDTTISIYKALKLLKAQNKLTKEAEKALLKDICIARDDAGKLKLV